MVELTAMGTLALTLALITTLALILVLTLRLKAARARVEELERARRAEQDAARAQRVGESWAHPQVPGRDLVGRRYMHTYMVACATPGSYGGTRNFSPQEWEEWVGGMGAEDETGLYKLQRLQRRLCEEYLAEVDRLQAEARCRKAQASAREAEAELEAAQHRLDCLKG